MFNNRRSAEGQRSLGQLADGPGKPLPEGCHLVYTVSSNIGGITSIEKIIKIPFETNEKVKEQIIIFKNIEQKFESAYGTSQRLQLYGECVKKYSKEDPNSPEIEFARYLASGKIINISC